LLESLAGLCAVQAPSDHLATVDRHAHGREEHRRIEVFTADRLDPDWRPFVACIARVSRRTLCRDTRTGLWRQRREVAYYACQILLDAQACAAAIRGHWGIENRDHHVRDRKLGEDASRIRRKPGIFARIRSFALNILRAHGVANVSEAIYTNALSFDRLLAYGLPKPQN
jgi:predicted transposase YbfD/YdcC